MGVDNGPSTTEFSLHIMDNRSWQGGSNANIQLASIMPGVISLHDQNADMPTQITQLQNERDDLRSQLMLLQRNANQREVEVEMEITALQNAINYHQDNNLTLSKKLEKANKLLEKINSVLRDHGGYIYTEYVCDACSKQPIENKVHYLKIGDGRIDLCEDCFHLGKEGGGHGNVIIHNQMIGIPGSSKDHLTFSQLGEMSSISGLNVHFDKDEDWWSKQQQQQQLPPAPPPPQQQQQQQPPQLPPAPELGDAPPQEQLPPPPPEQEMSMIEGGGGELAFEQQHPPPPPEQEESMVEGGIGGLAFEQQQLPPAPPPPPQPELGDAPPQQQHPPPPPEQEESMVEGGIGGLALDGPEEIEGVVEAAKHHPVNHPSDRWLPSAVGGVSELRASAQSWQINAADRLMRALAIDIPQRIKEQFDCQHVSLRETEFPNDIGRYLRMLTMVPMIFSRMLMGLSVSKEEIRDGNTRLLSERNTVRECLNKISEHVGVGLYELGVINQQKSKSLVLVYLYIDVHNFLNVPSLYHSEI